MCPRHFVLKTGIPPVLTMKKQKIRERILAQRRSLDPVAYSEMSRLAQNRLILTPAFQRADRLALYSPIRREVATGDMFLAARSAGKSVFYPRVAGENLEFVAVLSCDDLKTGAFGVAEPLDGDTTPIADLDLIVVPGVAFSLNGFRIGYGRGFYDRQLVQKPPSTVTVGMCFDFQMVEQLPTEEHDQPLDYIVTDTTFIPC